MKTLNLKLDPIVYQHRYEHPDVSFSSAINKTAPHLMGMRIDSRKKDYDAKKFTKVLFVKLAILAVISLLFTILSFVF